MKRRKNPHRFRKRHGTNNPARVANSAILHELTQRINRRHYAKALATIDSLVAAAPELGFKSKLLALSGDCLFKQGKFTDALQVYQAVTTLAQGDAIHWLRPAIGEIRALLKNGQVSEASSRAKEVVQAAIDFEQKYENDLAQAQSTIDAGGQATIPPRPQSAAAVAVRVGKHFFSEGEIDTAALFYNQALQLHPNHSKARLGLADVALRHGNGADASRLAGEVITGGLHRRSLPGYESIVKAAKISGGDVSTDDIISQLSDALPSVRARATLMIAKELRKHGDARWHQISDQWLQREGNDHPAFAAEFKKLKFATARRTLASPQTSLDRAQALLATSNLSPKEWLSAAKESTRSLLVSNQTPDLASTIADGATRTGVRHQAAIRHGLALASHKGGRPDIAIPLLQQNTADPTIRKKQRGRSMWRLARMHRSLGNHGDAANAFWNYSQRPDMPQRMRLTALVEWSRSIVAANQPDQLAQAMPQFQTALPQITDYSLLLDIARNLKYSQMSGDLANQFFERGKQLAIQAFDSCQHPSPAATILFKLCRRANDFTQYNVIIDTYTRMSDAKRTWLWSENSAYWNYIELVFRAFRETQINDRAEQFVTSFLDDPAIPPQGYAILGISYATLRRNLGDFQKMFSVYDRMIKVAPGYEWTSVAYYWNAVRALKNGDQAAADRFAHLILHCLGNDWTMAWKADVAAAALVIGAGLNVAQVPTNPQVTPAMLQKQADTIQSDIGRLPI
jgi:tetratricopeptide (TPR) repeat protein